jgi:rubrerythrin
MAKTIKSFKTSQTYKNLQNAFAGESQAANKYRYYSAKAKKDGFVYLSKVFEESSNNEVEHAKI